MKQIKRTFTPGSEWIYFKIYSGYKTLDNILLKEIYCIINKLNKLKIITKWFFIRYADPDPHIRVRFLIRDQSAIAEIMILLTKQLDYLVKSNCIWKIQIDTYNRELERYKYSLIEDAESIFCKDSECILKILRLIKRHQNENYRWMIALKMIDAFLSDFNFDLSSKLRFVESQNLSLKKEFGFNKYNSKQLNDIFRKNKAIVESVFNNSVSDISFSLYYKPIHERSNHNDLIIKKVTENTEKQEGRDTIDSLLPSFLHMMINRLFLSQNRLQELVLYDFMKRYYTSELVRRR